jgi:hypothetical protein
VKKSTLVQPNKDIGFDPGSFYEPGWVVHPINCQEVGCTCTPLETCKANDRIREQQLKEYCHKIPHNTKRRRQNETQQQSNPLEDWSE